VADNILKKNLEVTYENFLGPIFGTRSKPEAHALKTLFGALVAGGSTLVTKLSRTLRRDSSHAEGKRAQELVSSWLAAYDFSSAVNGWLPKGIPERPSDDLTFALDFSDISKEFGGEGMEGMAMGWDGSRGVKAMGHDFVCVSLVGAAYREARPVYVELAKGRRSKGEIHGRAIASVMGKTGGKGWIVEDRGMDDAKHLHNMKSKNFRTVVRVKTMDRDVFGNGETIDATLAHVPFSRAHLHVHSGDRAAEMRWREGVLQYCADPRRRDAAVENVRVLVVESRFDGKSLWLYVVCPDAELDDPAKVRANALRAAQAYCDRWQIETSFQVVKQEFGLEKARVRTFRRLENIFSLCVLAYVWATGHLRSSKGFKRILKALADNLEVVSTRTHALLAGIRALVKEDRIRFICGRPRKVPIPDERQMMFKF